MPGPWYCSSKGHHRWGVRGSSLLSHVCFSASVLHPQMLPSQPVTKNSNSVDLFLDGLCFSYVKMSRMTYQDGVSHLWGHLEWLWVVLGTLVSEAFMSLLKLGPGQLCQKGDGFG